MSKLNEISINAKIQALIQQRDIAQAAYVNLAGDYAVLASENEQLKDQVAKLSVFEGADVIEVDNG